MPGVFTDSSNSIVSSNPSDLFGVLRYQQGNAETPWRWVGAREWDEELQLLRGSTRDYLRGRAITVSRPPDWVYWLCVAGCMALGHSFEFCVKKCAGVPDIPPAPAPKPPEPAPNPCPPGTCPFKCPGAKDIGCGYPGTTVNCPDGTQIPLPKDCANQGQPPKEPPKQSRTSGVTISPRCTNGPCLMICVRF
jgi:hypothetical protein